MNFLAKISKDEDERAIQHTYIGPTYISRQISFSYAKMKKNKEVGLCALNDHIVWIASKYWVGPTHAK